MHGLLRCNINAGVHARGRSGRVTQRCHNSPERKPEYRVRVTSRTRSVRRIWGILKKVSWLSWVLPLEKTVDFHLLAEAWRRVRTRWGGQMKEPELKEWLSLSLCRRTFKLKVNKKFRTWSKKSLVFFVFRDSYVLCIYVMNILCTFRVVISWLRYTKFRVEYQNNAQIQIKFPSG